MKWLERIGTVLVVVGMICFIWAGGRWMSDTMTETVGKIGLVGIILAVVGVLMTNFDSDWLFRD